MKNRLLRWLLGILGFSTVATSCDPNKTGGGLGDQAAMYACPMAAYVANIEVKDGATDTPIEGIRVSALIRYDENYTDTLTTSLTDAKGKAILEWTTDIFNNGTIVADDIDGEANGGEYNSASTTLSTSSDDYEGGSGWNVGTATHNVTLTLTKK